MSEQRETNETENQGELSEEQLESAGGGVIDGGCIKLPWEPVIILPTFPVDYPWELKAEA